MVPGNSSVDGGSLAEGLGDLLATFRVNTGDGGVLVAVVDAEGEGVGGCGGALCVGHQLGPGLDRRLSLAAERRVVHLRARVGGEGLESGDRVEILMLAPAEVGGAAAAVVVVVVVDVGEGRVLCLRRVAVGEEVLELRRLHVGGVDGRGAAVVLQLVGFSCGIHGLMILLSRPPYKNERSESLIK